jgi:cardiolipin synthase A/B
MFTPDISRRLCEFAMAAIDASAVEEVCVALESGRLTASSTATVRSSLAQGNAQLEGQIRKLQELWTTALPGLHGGALALALRTGADGIQLERLMSPKTQIVWTGPKVEGSYVRATREIVREIVRGAQRELLIVGFWLAARDDGEGIIEELIALLSDAVGRGVAVTMVLDERQRSDGSDNRKILLEVWPETVPLPRLLTWRLPVGDKHLKLHAKVMVADDRDALVTSANLTWYAMDRNIEMGVRMVGQPAATIGLHMRLLDQHGTLQPF